MYLVDYNTNPIHVLVCWLHQIVILRPTHLPSRGKRRIGTTMRRHGSASKGWPMGCTSPVPSRPLWPGTTACGRWTASAPTAPPKSWWIWSRCVGGRQLGNWWGRGCCAWLVGWPPARLDIKDYVGFLSWWKLETAGSWHQDTCLNHCEVDD